MTADEAFERAFTRLVEKAPAEALDAALDAISQVRVVEINAFQLALYRRLVDAKKSPARGGANDQ